MAYAKALWDPVCLPSESIEAGLEIQVMQMKWSENNTGIKNIWLKPMPGLKQALKQQRIVCCIAGSLRQKP